MKFLFSLSFWNAQFPTSFLKSTTKLLSILYILSQYELRIRTRTLHTNRVPCADLPLCIFHSWPKYIVHRYVKPHKCRIIIRKMSNLLYNNIAHGNKNMLLLSRLLTPKKSYRKSAWCKNFIQLANYIVASNF